MTLVDPRGLVLVKVIWAEFAVASLVVILRVYATFFLRATDNPYAKAATSCTVLAWVRILTETLGFDRHFINSNYRSWDCSAMSPLSFPSTTERACTSWTSPKPCSPQHSSAVPSPTSSRDCPSRQPKPQSSSFCSRYSIVPKHAGSRSCWAS